MVRNILRVVHMHQETNVSPSRLSMGAFRKIILMALQVAIESGKGFNAEELDISLGCH